MKMKSQMSRRIKVVKKVVKVKAKTKKSTMLNVDGITGSAKKGPSHAAIARGKSQMNIKPTFSRETSND